MRSPSLTQFYTYLLHCADGSLYAGWTVDLDKRLTTHNTGKGAKYTRMRRPVSLAASWTFETRQEAMRWECKIKRLSRDQKRTLIDKQAIPAD